MIDEKSPTKKSECPISNNFILNLAAYFVFFRRIFENSRKILKISRCDTEKRVKLRNRGKPDFNVQVVGLIAQKVYYYLKPKLIAFTGWQNIHLIKNMFPVEEKKTLQLPLASKFRARRLNVVNRKLNRG